MDFMKVFDQTVREIQREVNLRVLKVPEMEQKVLDATCNEPWGPHGSALSEIAQATKKFADCQMIMNVLWTRLTDTGRNWRHVYKALAVIEYLVANGSERAVDDIIEHTFQISSLSGFEYVEPNGKDMGINVRKKVETILAILNNKEKIEEVRKKAAANREKYVGVSSSGMTYKSSSSSYGGSGYQQSGRYGGFGNSREDSHAADRDISGDDIDWNRAERPGARRGHTDESGETRYSSNEASRPKGSSNVTKSNRSSTALPTNDGDDFDDFDPRGTSSSGSAAAGTNQVDLFGGSLIDLIDEPAPAPAPAPAPTETNYVKTHASEDVDLFADADFVSATPLGDAKVDSATQPSVNLFEQHSASPATFSTPVDPFAAFTPSVPAEAPSSKLQSTASDSFDPFGAAPLNKFDGSDIFGDFTSSNAPAQSSVTGDAKSSDQKTTAESRPQTRKDTFQVKSGIWADSLSRGLIDLNISAPKKVSLADVGVVGGLPGNSATASAYMGQSMGIGLGPSGPTHAGIFAPPAAGNSSFSSFGQQQFGSFK